MADDSILEIPDLTPLNFVDKNRTLLPNYHWRHYDMWKWDEQLMEMESAPCKHQKWQNDDIIFLQFPCSISPLTLKVRNSKGKVVVSHIMDQVAVINSRAIYQDQIALDDLELFPEGLYWVEVWAGDPVQILLECDLIHVKPDHPGTLLLKYSNDYNNEILWELREYMTFRVDGVLPLDETDSNRTTYIDQRWNTATVKGVTFKIFKLSVGTQGGSPKWYFDKLENILDQTNVSIDGKSFAANVGAKIVKKKIDRYPLWQGEIDMLQVANNNSKRFNGSGFVPDKWATTYTIEGELFGPIHGPGNDNTYLIDKLT